MKIKVGGKEVEIRSHHYENLLTILQTPEKTLKKNTLVSRKEHVEILKEIIFKELYYQARIDMNLNHKIEEYQKLDLFQKPLLKAKQSILEKLNKEIKELNIHGTIALRDLIKSNEELIKNGGPENTKFDLSKEGFNRRSLVARPVLGFVISLMVLGLCAATVFFPPAALVAVPFVAQQVAAVVGVLALGASIVMGRRYFNKAKGAGYEVEVDDPELQRFTLKHVDPSNDGDSMYNKDIHLLAKDAVKADIKKHIEDKNKVYPQHSIDAAVSETMEQLEPLVDEVAADPVKNTEHIGSRDISQGNPPLMAKSATPEKLSSVDNKLNGPGQ